MCFENKKFEKFGYRAIVNQSDNNLIVKFYCVVLFVWSANIFDEPKSPSAQERLDVPAQRIRLVGACRKILLIFLTITAPFQFCIKSIFLLFFFRKKQTPRLLFETNCLTFNIAFS